MVGERGFIYLTVHRTGFKQGSHKSVTGLERQLLRTTYTECKQPKSFWSVLAKKAKFVLLDDDSSTYQQSNGGQSNNLQAQYTQSRPPTESKQPHWETPLVQRRLVALTSSLSSLGGSIGNAIEESLNKMEAKATDLMSSKKGSDSPRTPNLQDAFHVSGSFVRRDFFPKSLQQGQPFVEPSKSHDSDQKLQTSPPKQADSALKSSQHHFKEDSVLRPLQQQHSGHSATDKETQLKASRDEPSCQEERQPLVWNDYVRDEHERELGERTHIDWARWATSPVSSFAVWVESSYVDIEIMAMDSGIRRGIAARMVELDAAILDDWQQVAMAMAAKAKLLLRELKEAKADLAAAKDRCVQLEEENRIIRASINNGLKPDEEDLVGFSRRSHRVPFDTGLWPCLSLQGDKKLDLLQTTSTALDQQAQIQFHLRASR
ncbi:hypothetical protein L7F22_007207 [Adiantum nelumboides]|nr:hypothetical protein [Adiantum nelumboides]